MTREAQIYGNYPQVRIIKKYKKTFQKGNKTYVIFDNEIDKKITPWEETVRGHMGNTPINVRKRFLPGETRGLFWDKRRTLQSPGKNKLTRKKRNKKRGYY